MGKKNRAKKGSRVAKETTKAANKNNKSFSNSHDKKRKFGLYEIYKNATQSVKDGLRSMIPNDFRLEYVDDLSRASNYILDQTQSLLAPKLESDEATEIDMEQNMENKMNLEMEMEKSLNGMENVIRNLNTSITFRERVQKKFAQGSDKGNEKGNDSNSESESESNVEDGHLHMIDVLKYCRKILSYCRLQLSITFATDKKAEHENVDEMQNRFNVLCQLDDDDEDSGDDEEHEHESEDVMEKIIDQRRQGIETGPTRSKTSKSKIYTIDEDLIQGSDYDIVVAFFMSVNELMKLISEQYTHIKEVMRSRVASNSGDGVGDGDTHPSHLRLVIQAAAVASEAIKEVRYLENGLSFERPHLDFFINKIAVLKFSSKIEAMEEEFSANGKLEENRMTRREFRAKLIHNISFLIKNMTDPQVGAETCFGGYDPELEAITTVERLHPLALFVHNFIRDELLRFDGDAEPVKKEDKAPFIMNEFSHIGGDRCIIRTYLWMVHYYHQERKPTKAKKWNEFSNPAETINGMAKTFLHPYFLGILNLGGREHYRNDKEWYGVSGRECFPFGYIMGKVIANPEKGYPFSAAFGTHAILTSIFELQGDGDIMRLALDAQGTARRFLTQLPDHFDSQPLMDLFMVDTTERESYWSPLVAGGALLELHSMSMIIGTQKINRLKVYRKELLLCLHVYNSLRNFGSIGEVPVLSNLTAAFRDNKKMWRLGVEEKGSFRKHMWISTGSHSPGDVSHTYRRVVVRDFSDAKKEGDNGHAQTDIDSYVAEFVDRMELIKKSVIQDEENGILFLNLINFYDYIPNNRWWPKSLHSANEIKKFEQIMDQEVLKEEDLPKVRDVADSMTLYFNFVDTDRCRYKEERTPMPSRVMDTSWF